MAFSETNAEKSIVRVFCGQDEWCLGVRVNQWFILTAAHCLKCPDPNETENLATVRIGPLDGMSPDHDAFLLSWDGVADLAVLQEVNWKGSRDSSVVGRLDDDPTGTQARIRKQNTTWSTVSLSNRLEPPPRVRARVIAGEQMEKGDSGSPAFNSNGEVIALLTRSRDGHSHAKVVDVGRALPAWFPPP